MAYLIDTNVVSELIRKKPDKNVIQWFEHVQDESLYLSVITLGELRKGIEKLSDKKRRQRLKLWMENEIPAWFEERILSIDRAVADKWGYIQAHSKRTLPAIDSILIATALHHDLAMVTRNIKDFDLPSLEVINPWEDIKITS